MVRKRVREGFYLYLKRQNDPSWINAKCHTQATRGNPKERGATSRVLAWIGEVDE
jgi:hypothetical protein